MFLLKIMRGKTRSFLFGALSVFMATFLLNVMVLRINLMDSHEIWHGDRELNKEEAYENYVARGQRKPKAANENDFFKEIDQQTFISFELKHKDIQETSRSSERSDSNHGNMILQSLRQTITAKKEEEEDDYDEDEDSEGHDDNPPSNKEFQPGDFVNVSKIIFARPLLKYQDVQESERENSIDLHERLVRQNYQFLTGNQMVTDGIYWSQAAEDTVPKGMDQKEVFEVIRKSQISPVKSIHPPSWNKCGRPKNAFLELDNGSSFCARYRDPHNKLVLGEVMSFYLSRLLGMDSVPAVLLAITNQTSSRWKHVDISSVEWQDRKPVALIQWTPHMETVKSLVSIPKLLLSAYQSRTVITGEYLRNVTLNLNEISELVQWSSMVLFDFITGHYDRFASMQDGADQEKRPTILSDKVRNLLKSTKTNKLWWIDNESGLFDAYDLLYNTVGNSFIKYHKLMLQSVCVFQKTVVESISRLYTSENPHLVLEGFASRHEPLLGVFPKDFVYQTFKEKFKDRINEVYSWIRHCQVKNR